MNSVTIETFAQFIEETERHAENNEFSLFRGQGVKRHLLPRVARKDSKFNSTEIEKKMLSDLRRFGANFLDDSHKDDWELLVVAQHYGLATRLLDWTSNPLAALWFACAADEDQAGYVYALEASSLLIPLHSKKSPFDQSKTRVFQPCWNNARINAQHGWFTAHRYSERSGCFVKLEANPDVKEHLLEFIIPKQKREVMLKSLDRHGVNLRTMFPDLEGLCKYLNWRNTHG
ncbi:MAG: FRG domain-containing protein [Rhodomicrobium sp.]